DGIRAFHVTRVQTCALPICSDILSQPLDVSKFGLIYAGAQKNAGPAGVTVVVGRRSLLRSFAGAEAVPKILRYETHAKANSLYKIGRAASSDTVTRAGCDAP